MWRLDHAEASATDQPRAFVVRSPPSSRHRSPTRAQTKVYEGMIVGEYNKDGDLMVNPTKAKQLTNIRAAGSDDLVRARAPRAARPTPDSSALAPQVKLTPPRTFSLEDALTYITQDELLEVTPKSLRLRKLHLTQHDRKLNK